MRGFVNGVHVRVILLGGTLYPMKDWTHLFEKYRGKWVVLEKDEVTVRASGTTAREAYEAAHKRGILYRVPERLENFAGYGL